MSTETIATVFTATRRYDRARITIDTASITIRDETGTVLETIDGEVTMAGRNRWQLNTGTGFGVTINAADCTGCAANRPTKVTDL